MKERAMLKALRLTAVLLAGLAVPVLAQTPAPAQRGATPPPPPRTAPARPAPTAAPTAAPSVPAQAGGKIDINSASEQQLDELPGIGPALAKQIIAGRPWDDLNDLV